MPFPFAALMGLSSAVGAMGTLAAGQAQKSAAELNAFNIETQRSVNEAKARQNHNDRLEMYRNNLSANVASFASMGRDVSGVDRSVAAFLERQKEIASSDTARSDFMGAMESMTLTAQAAATRAEGRAAAQASRISAFTTMAGALYRYNQIKV